MKSFFAHFLTIFVLFISISSSVFSQIQKNNNETEERMKKIIGSDLLRKYSDLPSEILQGSVRDNFGLLYRLYRIYRLNENEVERILKAITLRLDLVGEKYHFIFGVRWLPEEILNLDKKAYYIENFLQDENQEVIKYAIRALTDLSYKGSAAKILRFIDSHGYVVMEYLLKVEAKEYEQKYLEIAKDNQRYYDTRILAMEALVNFYPNKYTNDIIGFLKDTHPMVRKKAIQLMTSLNIRDSIKHIVNLLDDDNEEVVEEAIYALGKLKATRCVQIISKFLDSDKEAVKIASLNVLQELNATEQAQKIANILRDKKQSSSVKIVCLRVLGYFQSKAHIDIIASFIEDKEPLLQKEAIETLTRLNAQEYLDRISSLIYSKNETIVKTAISALIKLKAKDHMDKIIELLDNRVDIDIKLLVLQAIAYLKLEKHYVKLLDILNDKSSENILKHNAISIIGILKIKKFADVVSKFLYSSDILLKEAAIYALSNLESDKYKEEVEKLLESQESLRIKIASLLYFIGLGDWKKAKDLSKILKELMDKNQISYLVKVFNFLNRFKNYDVFEELNQTYIERKLADFPELNENLINKLNKKYGIKFTLSKELKKLLQKNPIGFKSVSSIYLPVTLQPINNFEYSLYYLLDSCYEVPFITNNNIVRIITLNEALNYLEEMIEKY